MRNRANFLNCLCVLLSKPATAFRTNVLGVSRDADCVPANHQSDTSRMVYPHTISKNGGVGLFSAHPRSAAGSTSSIVSTSTKVISARTSSGIS
jgi:hypothetical protein